MILSFLLSSKPPYSLKPSILHLISLISENIGAIKAVNLHRPPTDLRKENRVRTIQASLEIEGNTLSLDQVTAILENKRVAGTKKDILEVQNAIAVYKQLDQLNPYSIDSFREAHGILMRGLIDAAGEFRSKAVGIAKGSEISHIAPSGEMLKPLLHELFDYLKNDDDLILIKSCVFHYEVEFIHPFMDGNGRMGRLWQTLILRERYPIFEFLPIESLIKTRQVEYYEAIEESDKAGNSTQFIEFMLEVILDSLKELLNLQNLKPKNTDRLDIFAAEWESEYFSRKDYLTRFRELSTATASRDLKFGVDQGIIEKTGEKNTSKYRFL